MSPGMPIPPKTLESIEFVLEHIFAPSTDPYSFGAVTKNITEILNQYTTVGIVVTRYGKDIRGVAARHNTAGSYVGVRAHI